MSLFPFKAFVLLQPVKANFAGRFLFTSPISITPCKKHSFCYMAPTGTPAG